MDDAHNMKLSEIEYALATVKSWMLHRDWFHDVKGATADKMEIDVAIRGKLMVAELGEPHNFANHDALCAEIRAACLRYLHAEIASLDAELRKVGVDPKR